MKSQVEVFEGNWVIHTRKLSKHVFIQRSNNFVLNSGLGMGAIRLETRVDELVAKGLTDLKKFSKSFKDF